MRQNQILNECLEQLRHLPPVKEVKQIKKADMVGEKQLGMLLEVETEMGLLHFRIEVKSILKRPIPDHLFILKEKSKVPVLLMAEYINESIANDLKRNQIYFIDSLGNAYIHILRSIYTDIQGKKPEKRREKQTTALFQSKGMQLLFILLTDKEAVNDTIRMLGSKANISIDRAFAVMKELKEKGYVLEVGKRQYRFVNKKALLENWLANYGDRLRPKLVLGTFRIAPSVEAILLEKLRSAFVNRKEMYAVGGSLGADLLIHYYRGPSTEIFIQPEIMNEVKSVLKLLPAREYNVTLLNLFSKQIIYCDERLRDPVAHPLLIYAELLYHGGGRAIEAAKLIYEKYLQKDFHEA
ncbi:MAG: hypothetical protein KAX28_08460 [Candidatus Marinimicrobia bacterium]|nr:hypothetical protein [Candidatus Neomarinimicrobiota bacterium]